MKRNYKKDDENKGLVLGICSIIFGIIIPVLGLVLGIIGLVRAKATTPKILNTIGICTSVLFWIVWAFLLI